MSGICGWVRWDGGAVEERGVRTMMAAAEHRGPDGSGVWCGEGAGLGHLALNVTPESVGERQPLHDEEAGLVLAADARIDNRGELIGALSPGGSPSDARLILAAYRRWGTDCAAHLIGDFAFAIWEEKERRLFAARDPMGMRAFYYRAERGRLLFATEIGQILAVPGAEPELFDPAVGAYLSGAPGPPEWTLYRGIEQIAPAHAIAVDREGRRQWRYWDIDPDHRIRYEHDEEYVEHFREVFRQAVRVRLRSTGLVGMLLSGGMDSGSIVSTAGWLRKRENDTATSSRDEAGESFPELRAYSYTFHELANCGERHISDPIAAHYDIPVTGVVADEVWPLVNYPEHGPIVDDPYLGVYQPLTEKTYSTAAAEGGRVVLTGDRGDEMVGDWVYDFPGLLKEGRWGALRKEFQAYSGSPGRGTLRLIRREFLGPLLTRLGRTPGTGLRRPDWVRSDFADRIDLDEIFENSSPEPPVRGAARRGRYRRIFRYGGPRMALWQERTAARLGLAWADPWADRRLAEFVLAIPQHQVHRVAEPKRIARRAAVGVIPVEARQAISKNIPEGLFDRGYREREVETVRSLIADSRAAELGYVDPAGIRDVYEEYLEGISPRFVFLWPLTFEAWLRRYWVDPS